MHLTFRQKIYFLIAIFAIPILVLTGLLFFSQTKDIDFAKKESVGVKYFQGITGVMHSLSILNLSLFDLDSKVLSLNIENAIQTVDEKIKMMEEVDHLHGEALEFSQQGLAEHKRDGNSLTQVKLNWNEAKANISDKKILDAKAKIRQIVKTIRTMEAHLGDTSNLILDPDLDSFYLVDLAIVTLPQNHERYFDIVDSVFLQSSDSQQSSEQLKNSINIYALRELDVAKIVADSETALVEDKKFYGESLSLQKNLPVVVKSYKTENESLLTQLSGLSLNTKVAERKAAILQGKAAIDSSFSLALSSSEELDKLLQKRIESLEITRAIYVGLVIFSLIVCSCFAIWIGFSMGRKVELISEKMTGYGNEVNSICSDFNRESQKLASESAVGASSLQESSASISQLAATIKQSAENSRAVKDLSTETNSIASEGERKFKELATSMNEISSDSRQIEDIIGVIEEIAFQTNLLALNAAVEAARAGEQGRGFAVVADAVRTLAQRSSDSAKDVNAKIRGNLNRIEKGVELARESGRTLESVVSHIQKVTDYNINVARSVEEQALGLSHISEAITQLDSITQGNASASQKIALEAGNLSQTSEKMRQGLVELESLFKKAA